MRICRILTVLLATMEKKFVFIIIIVCDFVHLILFDVYVQYLHRWPRNKNPKICPDVSVTINKVFIFIFFKFFKLFVV